MDLLHITKNSNFNNKSSPKASIAIPSSQHSSTKVKAKQPPSKNGAGQQSSTTLPHITLLQNQIVKSQ
jgi:hypothetical protein